MKLRDELVASGEIHELLAQHVALSAALRTAAKSVFEDDADVVMLAVAPVLLSAVELIDLKGAMPWSLVQEQLDIVPPPPTSRASREVGPRRVLFGDRSADLLHKVQSMPAQFSPRKMRSETSAAFMSGTRSMPPSMALRKPSDLFIGR